MIFTDRTDAAHRLAKRLVTYVTPQSLVLGLTRGGVLVAHVIASDLALSFAALVVKKIPSPHNGELAIGAVAPDDVIVLDTELIRQLGVNERYIHEEKRKLRSFINESMPLYQSQKFSSTLVGREVILTDDGIATGATFEAAMAWCRMIRVHRLIGAIPVAPRAVAARIRSLLDECIVLETPQDFQAVGQFYRNFAQVTDEEAVAVLRRSH